jgi:hypothetical protein
LLHLGHFAERVEKTLLDDVFLRRQATNASFTLLGFSRHRQWSELGKAADFLHLASGRPCRNSRTKLDHPQVSTECSRAFADERNQIGFWRPAAKRAAARSIASRGGGQYLKVVVEDRARISVGEIPRLDSALRRIPVA